MFTLSPTGHASLMKSNSDDMLDEILAEDSEEGRRAREILLHNTQLNSCSPPLSPTSACQESPRLCRAYSGAQEAGTGQANDSKLIKRAVECVEGETPEGPTGVLSILECHIS